jgi:hypothetical protein
MEIPLQTRAAADPGFGESRAGQADARQVIRRAVAADEHNWKVPGTTPLRNG